MDCSGLTAAATGEGEGYMSFLRKSYKRYSLGLVVAWAICLGLTWLLKGSAQFHIASLVCMGFFLGWLSTTIARNVYPKQPGLLG
jgi:hypothetical protein